LVLLTHYCAGDKIEKYKKAGHVAQAEKERGLYRILMEEPEGRRPLGRPRCSWEDNIKADLQEVGWGGG
jgi:hypothetical protein